MALTIMAAPVAAQTPLGNCLEVAGGMHGYCGTEATVAGQPAGADCRRDVPPYDPETSTVRDGCAVAAGGHELGVDRCSREVNHHGATYGSFECRTGLDDVAWRCGGTDDSGGDPRRNGAALIQTCTAGTDDAGVVCTDETRRGWTWASFTRTCTFSADAGQTTATYSCSEKYDSGTDYDPGETYEDSCVTRVQNANGTMAECTSDPVVTPSMILHQPTTNDLPYIDPLTQGVPTVGAPDPVDPPACTTG
jgi:hypothetical protein